MQATKWLGIELVEVSFKEKLISAVGSALAIYCVFWCTLSFLPSGAAIGVVASMGATAVLLFAVPHGQLSQPWPLIGGHLVSALIGVSCARLIANPVLATALAVGASIGVMHQLKCIHPPGGATAFTAVMGGQAIGDLGYLYVLYPVGLNAVVMLVLAVLINFPFRWRRYPAVLIKRTPPQEAANVLGSENDHHNLVEAVRSLDSFVDVSEEDLVYLSRIMASHYAERHSVSTGEADLTPSVRTRKAIDPWMTPSDSAPTNP